jgi:hypothetical protein
MRKGGFPDFCCFSIATAVSAGQNVINGGEVFIVTAIAARARLGPAEQS